MARSLIAVFTFFAATSALATPQIGDFASYNVAIEQNGQQSNLGLTREITQFDKNNNNYLIHQVISMADGSTQPSDNWEAADSFLSDSTIENILSNCIAAGGSPQQITVPAGTFNACGIGFNGDTSFGTAWVAKVSFGVARLDEVSKEDGTKTSISLASYR